MTKFSIEYNPYLTECKFFKDGERLKKDSNFDAKSNVIFQSILGKLGNWKGLLEEIEKACNDKQIELTFRGRKIDYEDLEDCVERYRGDVSFILNFQETKNDNDIIVELDQWIEEIRQKDLPEFHEKTDGKDIFEAYDCAKNGIFHISVIATMSSGKSTLINALLHRELLPSENKACTATIARIYDDDDMKDFEAECYAADEKTILYPRKKADAETLKKYNADEKVTYINIFGDIPEIPSNKIKLCLRDTPGPNNSRNENHGTLTRNLIRAEKSVILYIINATQYAIDDDKNLLLEIANEMKKAGKQSRDRFIFVINKCDELDEQKGETVENLLADVRKYLYQFGITDPILIPTSARLALLVRKERNGERLTRAERNEMISINDFVEFEQLHFEKYATLTPFVQAQMQEEIEKYHQNEDSWDLEGVIHTGVPAVEGMIKEYTEKYAFPMKIKDAVNDIIKILRALDMEAKFLDSLKEDKEQLEKVRMQIAEVRGKQEESESVYKEYKEKIGELSLGINQEDEEYKISKELETISRAYRDKGEIKKEEADWMIHRFQRQLREYEEDFESRLRLELEEKFYKRCEEMMTEYRLMLGRILQDINNIEGFDFSQTLNFQKVQFGNIDDLKNQYTKEHFHEETRWRLNPERQGGFLGLRRLKWWVDKKISYQVDVKDGDVVNVREVVGGVLSRFSNDMKVNVKVVFDQAREQMGGYIATFKRNIDKLDVEIGGIISDLERKTENVEVLKKSVEKNQELLAWVAEKKEKIEKILY